MQIDMEDIVILAGGLGVRLKHILSNRQKAMALVSGRPFLDYILTDLSNKGFRRAIIAVSYLADQVREFYGDRFGEMELKYSVEDVPLGTGGALLKASKLCEGDRFFAVNGDTYFNVDYNLIREKHIEQSAEITLAGKEKPNFKRHGTVVFDSDGIITEFAEKSFAERGYINGGIYLINKSVFNESYPEKFSFETDILQTLKKKTVCVPFDGYFIDIGVPQDYFRAQTEIPMLFGKRRFKAAFLDRDGVICMEKHHLYRCEDFEFIEGTPEAIETLREKGYLIVVITNQAGVAKGLYTESDVEKLHGYMKELLKDRTFIDAIYYCPYHPEGTVTEYRMKSLMRKPDIGMIEKAVSDFALKGIEIDLSGSIIVGDTENDIKTGINAAIGTKVLVRSGHGIDEENTCADIVADSLADYVDKYE